MEKDEMKRIAIVSCYFHHNYGSMIQALATQMVLDKLGYDNVTIDISGLRDEIKRAKIKYFVKAAISSGILVPKIGMAKNAFLKRYGSKEYIHSSKIRNEAFDSFASRYFRLSKRMNSKEKLSSYVANNYTTVIVGSDQLWLPANIAADYYTLNWVPDHINKVAYATSFGQAVLPRDIRKKAQRFLKRINHIGAREKSGQMLIDQILGRSAQVVCDPTLLLTGEEWMPIQSIDPMVDEPYILAYFLGKNKLHRDFVKKLKEKTGFKIVALIHLDEFVKEDERYADYTPYHVDPGDFLNLIRNAQYVCTDSFHCSAFSMLYEKCFFTFKRYSKDNDFSTNDRVITLLRQAGVYDRLLVGNEDISGCLKRNVDYKTVNHNIEKIRKLSYRFLTESIENLRSTDID